MPRKKSDKDANGWKAEASDLASAVAGGAIIGVPLLFTMEMWQHGVTLSSRHLLLLLVGGLLLNFAFDLLSGFRQKFSPAEAASEAVTSVAIGIVFSFVVLWMIGQLDFDAAPIDNLGKILIEALGVSVGVSFANSQIRRQSRTGDDDDADDDKKPDNPNAAQWKADLRDLGATVAGATVFALNVAPTEEVLFTATRVSVWQQFALLAANLAVCWIIMFASGFDQNENYTGSIAQKPLSETLFATAVSLCIAAILIYAVGQRPLLASPAIFISGTLSLGLCATVGGAAGRIVA